MKKLRLGLVLGMTLALALTNGLLGLGGTLDPVFRLLGFHW